MRRAARCSADIGARLFRNHFAGGRLLPGEEGVPSLQGHSLQPSTIASRFCASLFPVAIASNNALALGQLRGPTARETFEVMRENPCGTIAGQKNARSAHIAQTRMKSEQFGADDRT